MLRKSKEWDVRCPPSLRRMFPRAKRSGYYYKVDRRQAQRICNALSQAYGIALPVVQPCNPPPLFNGQCASDGRIWVHARGHMKSTFHEWYHHLDFATRGKYNSSDRQGGSSSLAWQFADRMFDALRSA